VNLPIFFDSMNASLKEIRINDILQTNQESQRFGLIITAEEAKEMVEVRNNVLKSYGRVDLGIEVIEKFIQCFCSSPFINDENYISTINDLQDIFYYMKNETEDKIGDDELIIIIKDFYNNSCGGSIERTKQMIEIFSWNIRRKNQMADSLLEGDEK